jgi:hypothetical protein
MRRKGVWKERFYFSGDGVYGDEKGKRGLGECEKRTM